MMSHFNDVTLTDLCLAPIPRLSGSVGGYIDAMCTHTHINCAGHSGMTL